MERKNRIIMEIYRSSLGISLTAMAIVGCLEIMMMSFTVVNKPLYGDYIWVYRSFYISLLTMAVVYIALYLFVRTDIKRKYVILNIANPVCTLLFFAWALGVTCYDAVKNGNVDPAVFMTFSLTVPLSFFLFPAVYGVIVAVADVVMLYVIITVSGSQALIINTSIFFIFQTVLGVSFLKIRMKLAERIVVEQDNADMDVLTGCPNRRRYMADMKKLNGTEKQNDLIYLAADVDGLKEVNDTKGHEAGDRLVIGAARCLEKCFGSFGKVYRIGGDEFAAIVHMEADEFKKLIDKYEESMKDWSEGTDVFLSTSYGYVFQSDHPYSSVTELAKTADSNMYAAKAEHHETFNNTIPFRTVTGGAAGDN